MTFFLFYQYLSLKLKKIYKIEKHNVEDSYKKIPLNVEGNKIDLILNKKNLYVDGIITHNSGDGTEKNFGIFQIQIWIKILNH